MSTLYTINSSTETSTSQLLTTNATTTTSPVAPAALAETRGGLAKVHGGEERGVRDEHRPEARGAREHQEITHPPENHLQSGRGRMSTGPNERRGGRGMRASKVGEGSEAREEGGG